MINYFTDMNTEGFSNEDLEEMNSEMAAWIDENVDIKDDIEFDELFKNALEKIFNKYC